MRIRTPPTKKEEKHKKALKKNTETRTKILCKRLTMCKPLALHRIVHTLHDKMFIIFKIA